MEKIKTNVRQSLINHRMRIPGISLREVLSKGQKETIHRHNTTMVIKYVKTFYLKGTNKYKQKQEWGSGV